MPKFARVLTDKEVKQRIKELTAKGREASFAVGGVSGLSIRFRNANSIQWALRLQAGSNRILSLGSYASMTLREARQEAIKIIEAGGKREEDAKKVAPRSSLKLSVLWPQWIENQRKRHQWKSEDDYRHATQRGEKYVYPILGDKPVTEITPKDIGALVLCNLYLTKPATAEKVRQCLRQFFAWCSSEELLDISKRLPTDQPLLEPYLPPKRFRETNNHHPMCPVDLLPDFVAELVKPERFNNVGSMALLFAILTNSRLANICRTHQVRDNYAVWEDIDLQQGVWRIPANKMKCPKNGANNVPLSTATVRILERLQALSLRHGDTVFQNRNGEPLSDGVFRKIIKTINAERAKAGLVQFLDQESNRPMTQHGTSRATFKTWALNNGEDNTVIEKALHHQIDQYGGAYARGAVLDPRRELAERWAGYCLSKAPSDWWKIK